MAPHLSCVQRTSQFFEVKMQPKMDNTLCGFRPGHRNADQIFTLERTFFAKLVDLVLHYLSLAVK